MKHLGRVGLTALLSTGVLLMPALWPATVGPRNSVALAASGMVLSPIGRQVAWLSLDAPRRHVLTSLADPAYVTDVTDTPSAPFAVISVSSPFGEQGPPGNDLARLDTSSGAMTPLLKRASGQESLVEPAWQADGSSLLVEREDLSSPLPAYRGESTPRYASRIDAVAPGGSVTSAVVPSGRMPSPSPDGSTVVFVQTTGQGSSLVLSSLADGTTTTLIPPGEFADIAYPRFSPAGDQIAFVVPEAFVGQASIGVAACDGWAFGPCVAFAHGLPWNLWLVGADGTNPHELAQVQADDGSVAWSPDGTMLLVYGGSGGFLVDASTGNSQLLPYLAGYGSVAWLSD